MGSVDGAGLRTTRFTAALVWAAELHAGQTRKGSHVPYVSHLLAVAGLVLEHGGDEDQAIAALLHDALEDTDATAADVEARFGGRVRAIVEGCSDTVERPKPDWWTRKTAYLAHLAHADPDVLLVSLADKVHNARTLAVDVERAPGSLDRFTGGPDGTRWYHRRLHDAFAARADDLPPACDEPGRTHPGGPQLLAELQRALDRMGATPEVATAYEAARGGAPRAG